MRAKWVRTDYGKGYEAGWVYRTYLYRGRTYVTYQNQKYGNAMGEELWRQHKAEQRKIDDELDRPQQEPEWETEEEAEQRKRDWDEVWEMLGL